MKHICQAILCLCLLPAAAAAQIPSLANTPPVSTTQAAQNPAPNTMGTPLSPMGANAPAKDAKATNLPLGIWWSDSRIPQAATMLQQNKVVDAIMLLDQVLAVHVRAADAHVLKAYGYYLLGDYAKAGQSIAYTLAIDPQHRGAYLYWAMIALKQDQPLQAEQNLGALKVLCQGTECAEYKTLEKLLLQAKTPKAN